jgi:hypothetical protein
VLGAAGRVAAQDLPRATGASTKGGIVARVVVKLGRQDATREIANYSLVLYRANHDSTILTTDDAGRITMIVSAGDYRLASVAPAIWGGGQYLWNVPLRVYAGMAVVELTASNAVGVVIPTFSHASPPGGNPLPSTSAPGEPAVGGPLTQPPRLCCMKDPAAAVLFSVVFPGGGQFYNGEGGKGVVLFLFEVGGLAAAGAGAASNDTCQGNLGYGCSGDQALLFIGAGVWLGSWIYSLVDASAGAHRHNRKLGFESPVALMVAPGGPGRTEVGLRLALR